MSSLARLMKKGDFHHGVDGLVGMAAEGAAGFGVSYLIGQAHHRYGDKWYGKNAPKLAAAAGKGLAVVAHYFGMSPLVVGGLDVAGQAGLNAMGLELGLRQARGSTGKKAVLVPQHTDVKTLPAGSSEATHMGALGKAAPGRGLTWDQIEELASGR